MAILLTKTPIIMFFCLGLVGINATGPDVEGCKTEACVALFVPCSFWIDFAFTSFCLLLAILLTHC